ncbi:MAG TPA: pantoate--beta-alanine ligase [bacterium]|nr:pantoate--beta-alanine ligase [bacterium]
MAAKIKVIKTVAAMQSWSEAQKRAGRSVGCVPTMGYLHDGHVALIRECAKLSDRVVMTLFVNPAQFGPREDLARYPRDFEGDCKKAAAGGAHAVFYPSVSEMYPEGYQTYVTVEEVTRDLEGAFRPIHFRGVATVCAKLFNAVRPTVAVFGEKDYQQLKTVERMARDLNLGLRIIGLPTVREPDGLAMSSRNVYLSADERRRALSISRALFAARDAVKNGEDRPYVLAKRALKTIAAEGLIPDYVEVRDAETLAPIKKIAAAARMLIAARVGKTRLIDNVAL